MRKLIKSILFGGIFLMIWCGTENILQKPANIDWNMKGIDRVRENPEYYDVLFTGTSMAIFNISVEQLYLKYGITSMTLGEPEQMTFLSYYTVEEALKYQKPKAVLFDVKSLFYSEERQKEMIEENEDYYIHYTVDKLKNLKTKYDVVTQVKELHSSTKYIDYFSTMYHNHANWEETSKRYKRMILFWKVEIHL